MRWEVAVTTAPRKRSTLLRCIDSIDAAGWDLPMVYAEPDSDLAGIDYCVVHQKNIGLGANWMFALRQSLEGRWDAILLMQDDAVLAEHCRRYVERSWPEQAHVLWLYRSERTRAMSGRSGWIRTEYKRQVAFGSLAVAMRRDEAKRIADQIGERLAKVRVGFDVHLQRLLDEKLHMRVYQHQPSLVQHVGKTSTLHPGMFLSTSRRAGHDCVTDAATLLEETER